MSVAPWQFWAPGPVLQRISGIEPLLASWERNTRPAQLRLQTYLAGVATALGPLPDQHGGLFLTLDVDVRDPARLLRKYDLENYLTPLVAHLSPARFCLVRATKRLGGGSALAVGIAKPAGTPGKAWQHFTCAAGSGTQTLRWKAELQAALAATAAVPLPPGPVAVQLAFRGSPTRNRPMLCKPAGDAMGPVLDSPFTPGQFSPADGRIVDLAFHRNPSAEQGHTDDVGMWWRPVAGSATAVPT